MTTATKQAAANCDRFEALIVGSFFQVVTRGNWRLIERYVKVAADRVQNVTDGRRWSFAEIGVSGGGLILVPDGARSVRDYVV